MFNISTSLIKGPFLIVALLFATRGGFAATEGMAQMPLAKELRTYTVTGSEDFKAIEGFGAEESRVRMMSLMMVGGSGYEGMDMGGMAEGAPAAPGVRPAPYEVKASFPSVPATVGKSVLDLTVLERDSHKPVRGLKLKTEVFMTAMDMGTEEADLREIAPGHYQGQVSFAMAGSWAVRVMPESREWETLLKIEVK